MKVGDNYSKRKLRRIIVLLSVVNVENISNINKLKEKNEIWLVSTDNTDINSNVEYDHMFNIDKKELGDLIEKVSPIAVISSEPIESNYDGLIYTSPYDWDMIISKYN